MVIKTSKPLDNAFIVETVNKKLSANHRLQRLQDYYEGKHDILLRNYHDKTKPNNKIIVNYCKNIADFLTAYLVGVPVKYEDAPQIILDTLNYNDNDETTQETIKNMNIFGFGCELFYTDGDGIARFASIDPRESIFIMNDSIEEVLTAFIRVYPKEDKDEGYNVTVYTDKAITQYDLSLSVGELKATGSEQAHYFNDVPVVFYPNNKEHIGTFEGVIPLQNALNKIVSDEINDFESFVDAYLVLNGMQATQSEDIAKMKQDRVLLLDGDSKAEWLVKDVNNTHIKELKESILKRIRELGCIPDIEDLGSFGASGVALKFKLIPTEIQASKQERIIKRGIQRKLELLYNILLITDKSVGNYTDIDVVFERNFIMILDDKINQMTMDLQLVNSELMSRETFLMRNAEMTPAEVKKELKTIDKFHYETSDQYADTFKTHKEKEVEENE
ncbi:MAG: phage portal protein [Eubacterium sp.]|jgi:SPP1 family phage portal protein|nr:phage portal protein [Eubacterium sp.]